MGAYSRQPRNKSIKKLKAKKKLAVGGTCTPSRHLVVKTTHNEMLSSSWYEQHHNACDMRAALEKQKVPRARHY